jgi:exonuclease III
MQNHVIEFLPLNKRACKLIIRNKYNFTLISCYTPTEDKEDEVRGQFCEKIQRLVENVPKRYTVIIIGDFNAQLGKEEAYNPICGKHMLHEETNRNREMLFDFAITHNLVVMST